MRLHSKTCAAGQVPQFGAIFMSNIDSKNECLSRKLLGLPMTQMDFVKQVKAGMVLFLFEFERRELHGVFRACSDGAINIVPHAFKSSGKQFPAQVKFTPIWHCKPLAESEFRDAIKENYFSGKKFNFGLSAEQIQKLLLLFSHKKLEANHFDGHLTQSKFAKQIKYDVNMTTSAVGGRSFLLVNDENNEERAVANSGSMTGKFSEDYINNYVEAINANMNASASVKHEHKGQSDFGVLFSDGQFGEPPSRLGRSVDSVQMRTSNETIKKHGVGIYPGSVGLTDCPGTSFTAGGSVPNQIAHTTLSGQENEWNDHNAAHPRVSNRYLDLDFSWSKPQLYSSNCISEENSLTTDQLRQSSAMWRLGSSQGLNTSHSIALPNANNVPYDPDIPALNYIHSLPAGLSKSVPGCSIDDDIFPHLERQSLSSYVEPESTSKQNVDSDVSNGVPISFYDTSIPHLANMYSTREMKRESVFSRLTLPPEYDGEDGHKECGADSSVDEVMLMLHDSHFDWVKARDSEKHVRRQNNSTKVRKKRSSTLKSRPYKVNILNTSKETARNCISSSEDEVVQKTEQIPLLDFRRRSEVQKCKNDSNSGGCSRSVDNNAFSDGQRKRRKLIRPKFCVNEAPADVNVGSTDMGHDKSEISDLPHNGVQKIMDNEQNLLICYEEKHVKVEKKSDYDVGENASIVLEQ